MGQSGKTCALGGGGQPKRSPLLVCVCSRRGSNISVFILEEVKLREISFYIKVN